MADREDRSALRPLRPAVPPAPGTGTGRIPRPRRTSDDPAADSPTATEPTTPTPKPDPVTVAADATEATGTEATDATGTIVPTAGVETNTAETTTDDTKSTGATSDDTELTKTTAAGTTTAGTATDDDTKPTETASDGAEAAGAASAGDKPEGAEEAGAASGPAGDKPEGAEEAGGTKRQRRYRIPFRRRLRMPPPRQVAVATVRATRDWSRRPSGRLTLPGVFLLALVATTATAGALLVPATARAPRPAAVDASASPGATEWPGAGQPTPGGSLPPVNPGGPGLPGTVPGFPGGGRPADALADWAQRTGQRTGIAPVAMQAYGYAELVLAQSNPSCALSWTTLAAIGFVESGHGQANRATLQPDGQALPEIIGLPLDGQGGRQRIMDTDGGQLDRDRTYDRAVGPMQFIPTTWQEIGADADGDGVKNPHDLDDAALAAGNYLCKGGRNLSIAGDWWGAILSYNDVRRYAQDVYDTANKYGIASRT